MYIAKDWCYNYNVVKQCYAVKGTVIMVKILVIVVWKLNYSSKLEEMIEFYWNRYAK